MLGRLAAFGGTCWSRPTIAIALRDETNIPSFGGGPRIKSPKATKSPSASIATPWNRLPIAVLGRLAMRSFWIAQSWMGVAERATDQMPFRPPLLFATKNVSPCALTAQSVGSMSVTVPGVPGEVLRAAKLVPGSVVPS